MELPFFAPILIVISLAVVVFVTARPGASPGQAIFEAIDLPASSFGI